MATPPLSFGIPRGESSRYSQDQRGLLIFDADDTLWATEVLYDDARSECRDLVIREGLDGDKWEQIQKIVDAANVARFGLTPMRFPTSCVEAYRSIVGSHSSACVEELIFSHASKVFNTTADLFPGTRHVLEGLSAGYSLALLTQGDESVQRKRVRDSGLADLFSRVEVVPNKTESSFLNLIQGLSPRIDRVWSIGNSLASDIYPALRVGLSAIWIPAETWESPQDEFVPKDVRLKICSSIKEVENVLGGDRVFK
jgi:putative hydrolase of the HAD superfamily